MKFLNQLCLALLAPVLAIGQSSQTADAPISLLPANPHYFLYHGKAIALVTSGEHYGAVINPDFDYHKYLDTLAAEGMNYTRLFTGSYVEVPGKSFGIQRNDIAPAPGRLLAPWKRSATAGYAGGGSRFDLDQWSPEYLARLHGFLSEAEKKNIVVEISLFSSQYGEAQWNYSPFRNANNINNTGSLPWKNINTLDNGGLLKYQEALVRKLVHETSSFPNVIYEIQNEPFSDHPRPLGVVNPYIFPPARTMFPNSIEAADAASIAWQTQVAAWIKSEESSLPNKHLIAQNYCDFGYPAKEIIPGVSLVNFHYAFPAAPPANSGLGKAIGYDETGFLGRDDDSYLRQAWNFMMSGGSTFDALDYSFSVGHEDGSDTEPNGPGGGSANFRRELAILSRLLNNLPLATLAPDFHIVANGGGTHPHALSSRDQIYAIYLDGSGPTEITLALPTGSYQGKWIDIHTGAEQKLQPFQHPSGMKTLQTPPFQAGIALLLKRNAAN